MKYSVRRLGAMRSTLIVEAKSVDDLWWIVDDRFGDPSGYEHRVISDDAWTRFKFADEPDSPVAKLVLRQKQRAALRRVGILK